MICTKSFGQGSDFTYGVFKHLGVGLNVSTTGIGFDVATDLTKYVGLRAGVSFMPSFNVNGDLDVRDSFVPSYSLFHRIRDAFEM